MTSHKPSAMDRALYEYVHTRKVDPIWRSALKDIDVIPHDIPVYNRIFGDVATKDVTIVYCRAYLYSTKELLSVYRSLQEMKLSRLCDKSNFVTQKNDIVGAEYVNDSIKDSNFVVIVYGLREKEGDHKMTAAPIGFSTLKYTHALSVVFGDHHDALRRPYPKFKHSMYIDVTCSPFQKSNVAAQTLAMLESATLRQHLRSDEIKNRLLPTFEPYRRPDIMTRGIAYDAISLQALPQSYMYFIAKCNFVRTNGNGFQYPFVYLKLHYRNVVSKAALYETNDLAKIPYPTEVGFYTPYWDYNHSIKFTPVKSRSQLQELIQPFQVFSSDSENNGYLCAKYLGELHSTIGGAKRKRKKVAKKTAKKTKRRSPRKSRRPTQANI